MFGDKFLFSSWALGKSQRWNIRLLAYAIVFTIFSGAIRKWLISSSILNNLFFLFQLIIPLLLIISFKKIKIKKISGTIFFIYIIFLMIFAFNPLNQTVYHGAFGIILHGGLWVLLFIYFDSPNQFPVEKLIPLLIFFMIFEFLLTQWQYQMPYNHFINKYVGDGSSRIATMAGRTVRVTGSFSFLSGFTAYLFCSSFLVWAIAKLRYPKFIIYALAGLVILGSLQSGSRGTLISSLIIICLAIYTNIKNGNIIKNSFQVAFLVLIFGIGAYTQKSVQRGVSNFVYRFNSGLATNEYNARTIGAIEEVVHFKGTYSLFGIGLGSTYQGANAIWGESKYAKQYPGGYEEELERIVIEGGYLLFLFKLILLAILFFRSRIPKIFMLGIIVIQLMTFPLVFNIYNAFFFFIAIILIDRAYLLADQRRTLSIPQR
jgi:hypothetical protein